MSEKAFLKNLQHYFESENKESPLHALRKKGFEKFLEMGLPQKAEEAFRYVPLRELYQSSFDKPHFKKLDKALFSEAVLPECKHSYILFVDGMFSPELSDITALSSALHLFSLEEGFQAQGVFLQSWFARLLKEEKDPFALLNLALHPQGAFAYLPPNIAIDQPLQCLSVFTGDKPEASYLRLHLALGKHSALRTIFTTYDLHSGHSHFISAATEIFQEEGSQLDVLNLGLSGAHWHFETLRCGLKRDARFKSLHANCGGKAARQSYHIQLKGENSDASLNGIWFLENKNTAHTHVIVEHEAPHARSMQKFKGVLNDHSQSSFEGKIVVHPQAQKTEAYQLNNNLILHPGAIANSKPNLEIFADDVKASHGATISQLDEDQIFYLRARGISDDLAKDLLLEGFCREMIGEIPYDSVSQRLNAALYPR